MILAALTFGLLWFVPAPYGRHTRRGWGLSLPSRWAWLIMEAPASLLVAAFFLGSGPPWRLTETILILMWEAHYVFRAFIYPWKLSPQSRRVPLAIVSLGFFFNVVNATLHGYDLFVRSGRYAPSWLARPHFMLGLALFVVGMTINRRADRALRELRNRGSDYAVPRGGLFRWVSCPNYLGEIIEWIGWALATLSPAALAFALWVIANLAPRARTHHRWYRERFANYPTERRALLPRLW
ncbi:MAG: DUF1295 domain-containing protein [Anaerolineae bacterium]|nr:DUF1295 domain-containing protein [Anaerolineae bacterium]